MPLTNPPAVPSRRNPAQFPADFETYLSWINGQLAPELIRLAPALSTSVAALSRANHTGTQGIGTIAGLTEALGTKANISHTHPISQVTGLSAELSRRPTVAISDRPGDYPLAFSEMLRGDPSEKPLLPYPVETVDGLGRVIRINGAGHLGMRQPIAIGTDTHRIVARVRRAQNPLDPNNDAVHLAVVWQNERYETITGTVAAVATNLRVTSGLVELSATVSGLGLGGALTPPAGAVYFVPYVQTFGSDSATWVATLRRSDTLVQAIVGETDLTQVIAQAQAATAAAQAAANSYRGEVVYGFSAVQAFTRPAGVSSIMVAWGDAPWDGMGGEYARDANDTTSPHNPPQTLLGADGTRWKRISSAFDALRLINLENDYSWLLSRVGNLEELSFDQVLARIAALEQNGGGSGGGGTVDPALAGTVANHETRLDAVEAWATGVVIRTETGANLANASHAVNTTGKDAGEYIWDSTNKRLLRADGPGATDPWYAVDGSGSVTPGGDVVLPPPSTLTWEGITQQANGPITVGGREWKFNTPLLPHSIRRLAGNPDWLKFMVRDGDIRSPDPTDRHRSELSGSNFPFTGAQGELWASQWAIPLQQSPAHFVASFQFFDNGYDSPSAKLEDRGGTGNEINIAGGLSTNRMQTPAWQGPRFQNERRYHRLWRIVQDPQYGELDFWVNGILIVSLRNVPIGQGAIPSAYLKYGLYCDDNNNPMGDQEWVFGPMEIATGTNALLARRDAPPTVPGVLSSLYPVGAFGLGTKIITDGQGAGEVATGDNLLDDLAAPQLLLMDFREGVATYSSTLHRLQLRGNNVNYGAAAVFTIPNTVEGATYQYGGSLSGTTMNSRVGTSSLGENILSSIVHQQGLIGRSFVGTGGTVYLSFNKQSSANTATLSSMYLTGPA